MLLVAWTVGPMQNGIHRFTNQDWNDSLSRTEIHDALPLESSSVKRMLEQLMDIAFGELTAEFHSNCFCNLCQRKALLRASNSLSSGERELIATYVSYLNDATTASRSTAPSPPPI